MKPTTEEPAWYASSVYAPMKPKEACCIHVDATQSCTTDIGDGWTARTCRPCDFILNVALGSVPLVNGRSATLAT